MHAVNDGDDVVEDDGEDDDADDNVDVDDDVDDTYPLRNIFILTTRTASADTNRTPFQANPLSPLDS